jgi:hypothetical protein
MSEENKEKEKHKCCRCKKAFLKSQLLYGPDPYEQEVNGDRKKVYLCEDCYNILCDDI